MTTGARRHGVHEVHKGKNKGRLHIAPRNYVALVGQIEYLASYLFRRLLPQESEDRSLASILLALQNVIEYELELTIKAFVDANPTSKNSSFAAQIENGFVSFKTKFTWARARGLVDDHKHDVMEQIRLIRNAQTHARPSRQRRRYHYFGRPLLTRKAIRELFTDANSVVLHLRQASGNKERWKVIPPGYAEEMGWQLD